MTKKKTTPVRKARRAAGVGAKVPMGDRADQISERNRSSFGSALDAMGPRPDPGSLPQASESAGDDRHQPLRYAFPWAVNQVWTPRRTALTRDTFLGPKDRTTGKRPVTRQMIEAMAGGIGGVQGGLLKLLLNPRATDRLLDRMGERARLLDPILHNTVSATGLRGSDKFNVIPGEVELVLDGRLLPGFEPQHMLDELRALTGTDAYLEVIKHDPGPPEADLSLFGTLGAILEEADPGSKAIPLLMPGVSDARFFARLASRRTGSRR